MSLAVEVTPGRSEALVCPHDWDEPRQQALRVRCIVSRPSVLQWRVGVRIGDAEGRF